MSYLGSAATKLQIDANEATKVDVAEKRARSDRLQTTTQFVTPQIQTPPIGHHIAHGFAQGEVRHENDVEAPEHTPLPNLNLMSPPAQDNPTSIYPDPEPHLSTNRAQPSSRASEQTVGTASINPDGTSTNAAGLVVHTAAMNPDGTSDKNGIAARPKKKRAPARKRKEPQEVVEDNADEDPDDIRATLVKKITKAQQVPGEKRSRKKKSSTTERKKRAETPEGAEDEMVDPTAVTMSDVCKDLKIGRKFSRHDDIKQRHIDQKQERKRLKAIEDKKMFGSLTDDEEETRGEAENSEQVEGAEVEGQVVVRARDPSPEPDASTLPKVQVIGNRLVIDPKSLQINRNARADAERDLEEAVVRVDDFSRVFTSGTHMKREKGREWSEAEEEKFWEMLTQFGTDFGMMSQFFGRTRTARQCKLKYHKMERENPGRITRIFNCIGKPLLIDGSTIDLTDEQPSQPSQPFQPTEDDVLVKYRREVEASMGERMEDPKAIMASLAEKENEQRLEEEAVLKATEAERQKKRDEIKAKGTFKGSASANASMSASERARQILQSVDDNDDNENGREASAAPKTKRKAGIVKKGKKNPHSSTYGGGETEVVLETIEN